MPRGESVEGMDPSPRENPLPRPRQCGHSDIQHVCLYFLHVDGCHTVMQILSAHTIILPCEAFSLILTSRGWRTVIISLQIWSNTRLLMVSLTQALGVTGGSPFERRNLEPRWLSDSSTLDHRDKKWSVVIIRHGHASCTCTKCNWDYNITTCR